MKDATETVTSESSISRRRAIVGFAALLAAGSGLSLLGEASAREAEPGDDHGGKGNDDHGRRHHRRRHRRRHK